MQFHCMKIKRVFNLILLLLIGLFVYAESPSEKYVKEPEDAILEVSYERRSIRDTTKRSPVLDSTILRVGKTKSMYCGARKLWADSMMKIDYSAYSSVSRAAFKNKDYFPGGRYWSYIYKDFSNNKCKEYEFFNLEFEKYDEFLEIPQWEVYDSVKIILGYECFKALTNFRGRQWVAWFTPEIPISDGPWKLHGLPGLILEAYDVSHDYKFEAKGIRTSGLGKVGYMEYDDYVTVTRDQHMKNWWKAKHDNVVAKIQAAYGIKTSNKPTTEKRIPKYDREEIDYDHNLK